MDYRTIDAEGLPEGLPEAVFRKELSIRRDAHNLKVSAAFCLRSQTQERMPELQPESFFEHLTQMQAESADPQAFARRILVEQTALAKLSVEDLMTRSAMSDDPDVKNECLATAARLMAQLRKNLEFLAQFPTSTSPEKGPSRSPDKVTDQEVLEHYGYGKSLSDPEPEENHVSELGSKDAATEAEESQEGCSGKNQPYEAARTQRSRPRALAGYGSGQSAVAQGYGATDSGRKSSVGQKRPAREDPVEAGDQTIALIREAAARKYAEIADQFAQSCALK